MLGAAVTVVVVGISSVVVTAVVVVVSFLIGSGLTDTLGLTLVVVGAGDGSSVTGNVVVETAKTVVVVGAAGVGSFVAVPLGSGSCNVYKVYLL